MSLIQVTDLSFTYEGSCDPVFEHVSFQIDTDWRLGFTGRNGRGKTTFLNLLMNRFEYSGSIVSSVAFDYFPFPVPDQERDTQEILDSLLGDYLFWELKRELTKLQVSEDVLYRPFSTLSSGERTKVLLAALFLREGRFLLIDEPTNHLDREARELVSQYLNSKKGFILVSHDRKFLDASVDHILSINKTNIEVQKGNFTSWYENKLRLDQYERSENERLKKDIRHLEAAARQSGEWADRVESTKIGRKSMIHEKSIDTRAYVGEKSRRMQMRRKNLELRQERAIGDKTGLLKNVEEAENLKLYPLKHHAVRILSLKDVVPCYDSPVCEPVSFTLEQGQRISLQGKNGCGKSSILKLIIGGELSKTNISYEGSMEMAGGLKISYVSQDTSFLKGSLTEYARISGVEDSLFKTLLRKLDFSREQFEKPMESYSEGQKKKVLIARSLCEQAHLYVWDEPLNFIDVYSRIQIEDLILKFQPAMLLVEHDETFTDHVGTHMVHIKQKI
ncbi:ribosomal protection-like ABC-F family protein [Clostridium sp. Marseille-P2415]|uniref:ribosomal protection-like ABC-F family protein n=1 Tax=Clostridium sp. Marseille-P2415 TaxID=1805471 RepID=UPI00098838BE|nr:ABC-F type ribosomal protection protein [Clostridium sp. Marseille-P2415]